MLGGVYEVNIIDNEPVKTIHYLDKENMWDLEEGWKVSRIKLKHGHFGATAVLAPDSLTLCPVTPPTTTTTRSSTTITTTSTSSGVKNNVSILVLIFATFLKFKTR